MDAAEIKLDILRKIENLKGKKLQEVYAILLNCINSNKPIDSWEALSNYEKSSIEEGLSQLNAGEGISHKEIMAKYRKKYSK